MCFCKQVHHGEGHAESARSSRDAVSSGEPDREGHDSEAPHMTTHGAGMAEANGKEAVAQEPKQELSAARDKPSEVSTGDSHALCLIFLCSTCRTLAKGLTFRIVSDQVPLSSIVSTNSVLSPVKMTCWRAGRRRASKRSRSAAEGCEGAPAAPSKKQQTRYTRSGH